MVSIEIFVGKRVSVLFKLKKTAFSKRNRDAAFSLDTKVPVAKANRFPVKAHITGGAENARKNYFSLHRMQKQKLQQ